MSHNLGGVNIFIFSFYHHFGYHLFYIIIIICLSSSNSLSFFYHLQGQALQLRHADIERSLEGRERWLGRACSPLFRGMAGKAIETTTLVAKQWILYSTPIYHFVHLGLSAVGIRYHIIIKGSLEVQSSVLRMFTSQVNVSYSKG